MQHAVADESVTGEAPTTRAGWPSEPATLPAFAESATVRAADAHVEELIEDFSLATVLAYAALRLPPLPTNVDDENMADGRECPTAPAREAETIAAAPVSGVVRRPRRNEVE